MNEKLKNKKIPVTLEKDLVGFEDVLDLLEEDVSKKNGAITKDNHADNYDLYHFLEQEHVRMKKMYDFWINQYPAFIKNEKIEYLLKRQNELNFELREQIVTKLSPPNSPFHAQMRYLWDKSMRD
jgi:hypothetical protein